jgi:hypothetical protein
VGLDTTTTAAVGVLDGPTSFEQTSASATNAGREAAEAHKLYMNTASKLGPHTQTDRGTCPGVGL